MKIPTEGGQQDLCVYLGLAKAFGLVNWKALLSTLAAMIFSKTFIRLIHECILTISFSLLVEGEATNRFYGGRGLRQGDPLSPLLFNILMENLSQTYHLAEKNGDLEPYIINGRSLISLTSPIYRCLMFHQGYN